MNIKNNLPIIFGISIPILMVIFVVLSIYIPQLFIKPQYNFIYVTGDNNCFVDRKNVQIYSVANNKIVKNVSDESFQNCIAGTMPQPKLFLYNVADNTNTEVLVGGINNLFIDSSQRSPDGFEIVQGSYSGGFFPFYFYSHSDYSSRYISGHNFSKKLNIQPEGSYYNFALLGWVK